MGGTERSHIFRRVMRGTERSYFFRRVMRGTERSQICYEATSPPKQPKRPLRVPKSHPEERRRNRAAFGGTIAEPKEGRRHFFPFLGGPLVPPGPENNVEEILGVDLEAPKGSQETPKSTQKRPKRAPRSSQDHLRIENVDFSEFVERLSPNPGF